MLRVPSSSTLLKVLAGETTSPPPIWLMRQAGRYLPEYRQVRGNVASFLDLCLTPELAAEVTLQPLRRFAFDAAIVFSDILIIPFALGQKVEFVEGEGPRLEPVTDGRAISRLDRGGAAKTLAPVYETIERVVAELPPSVPLIGFCGAPWTVATYMVEGGGSKDQAAARLLAYRDPATFQRLIDLLVESSADYPAEPSQSRRPRPADFRQLGRKPFRGYLRALVHRADQETSRARQGRSAGDARDRLSARRRLARRALRQGDGRRCHWLRYEPAPCFDQRQATDPRSGAGQSRSGPARRRRLRT